jgi:hypothetical protein
MNSVPLAHTGCPLNPIFIAGVIVYQDASTARLRFHGGVRFCSATERGKPTSAGLRAAWSEH